MLYLLDTADRKEASPARLFRQLVYRAIRNLILSFVLGERLSSSSMTEKRDV
jgi:hypothetical protein